MLLTPHSILGASIGELVNSWPIVLVLGILSHYILDALPHFDWGTWHENEDDFVPNTRDYILACLDIILTIVSIVYIFIKLKYNYLILLGAGSAILPDLIDNVPFWKYQVRKTKFGKFTHQIHCAIHYRLKYKYWYIGILTQLIIIGGSLLVLF